MHVCLRDDLPSLIELEGRGAGEGRAEIFLLMVHLLFVKFKTNHRNSRRDIGEQQRRRERYYISQPFIVLYANGS